MSYKTLLHQINTFIFDVDGVLTNGNLTITTEGELLRTMNVKDGYAIKMALDAGCKVCVISGGSNEGVSKRLKALGIEDVFLGAHNKIDLYHNLITKYSLEASEIFYMGDDVPDIEVMQQVGLPCCPQDAVPEVKAISKYISHKKGGKGAVRDVIEQVLKLKHKWPVNASAKYD